MRQCAYRIEQATVMPPSPRVLRAEVIAQRLFDVAYAIDLERAAAAWATDGRAAPVRRSFSAAPAKAVAWDVPPLTLRVRRVALDVAGTPCDAEVLAQVYDFGVVALSIAVTVADLDWPDFAARVQAVDAAVGPRGDGRIYSETLALVRDVLGAALERPSSSTLEEDYLIASVGAFDAPLTAQQVLEQIDLAPLLSGEQRPLSEAARRELLKHQHSWYADDLVVLTWDRAFVYEPWGDTDVADVLEVANAQLLELSYYDRLLDDELPRMYGLVARTQRAFNLVAPRRLADLARKLYALVAETTELTEKVDNALRITEDVYLARVHAAALEAMRVYPLRASVERKLAIIRDTYAALYDEASATRANLLELTIIALIVLEIVLALVRG